MTRDLTSSFEVSDESLMQRTAKRDQQALGTLFARYEKQVYNLLYRMLSRPDDAEEALGEVFVKVWNNARAFKGESKFSTWLFRIASNTAKDFLRKRQSVKETTLEDGPSEASEMINQGQAPDPENALILKADSERITKAMKQLSYEEKMLISLYHFQELEYTEITAITGIDSNNLKVKLFRARRKLKKIYDDMHGEGEGEQNEVRKSATDTARLRKGLAEFA